MNNASLHSHYNPQLEADRYIEALNLPPDIDYFVLIEPGEGYLIPALGKKYPASKSVVLHADSSFRITEVNYTDVPMWFPDCLQGVQEFLEGIIPEGASVRVIEWRPSLRIYGEACLNLVRESAEFIKRLEASRRTGAAFGRRWVRNFFRNVTLLDKTLLYRAMDTPIVITGSGPGLEAALPEIYAARRSVFIMAASSSVPALLARGITADMVISTDGSGWALLHLHACFRTGRVAPKAASPTKLALALSAAIPSQCSALPLLLMNDGSLWQSIALHSLGLPSVLIPQRGTVTASALELALVLGSGSIFLAGMDFAVSDIRSHARPYGFDHLFFGTASRFKPVYSQCFMRAGDMKAGGSHDVYAAWFKNRIAAEHGRIFSLGGNHPVLANGLPRADLPSVNLPRADLPSVNLPQADLSVAGGGGAGHFQTVAVTIPPAQRCAIAVDALIAALHKGEYADALCGELAPLLFPSRSDVLPAEIAEALKDIAFQYRDSHG